jgi:hypothetical protein
MNDYWISAEKAGSVKGKGSAILDDQMSSYWENAAKAKESGETTMGEAAPEAPAE